MRGKYTWYFGTKLLNIPQIFKNKSEYGCSFDILSLVELGARLSNTLVYKVLKHSLKYLLNRLKQNIRAYKRTQVRQKRA